MPSSVLHKNRLVGFFDVLGFSALLENHEVEKVYESLKFFIDQAKNKDFFNDEVTAESETKKVSNFEVTQFAFDTLILVSTDPERVHSDANFIFACIQIMQTSMQAGLALRGAIGCGDVLCDLERGILLSKELPQLARLEKEQEWMGCCLTDLAMERVREPLFGSNFVFDAHSAIVPWNVPMKTSNYGQPGYALNWLATTPDIVWKPMLERLISAKKIPTQEFVQAISGAPNFRQSVVPPALPVHEFRYMGTRLKVSFLFLNERGEPVDPAMPLQITMNDGNGNIQTLVFGGN